MKITGRTPVFGDAVQPERVKTPGQQIASLASSQAKSVQDLAPDLQALSEAKRALAAGQASKMLGNLLPSTLGQGLRAQTAASSVRIQTLQSSLRQLAKIYQDDEVDEEELLSLVRASGRLRRILRLKDALDLLDQGTKKRLEQELFEPLEALVDTADKHSRQLFDAIEARDREAVHIRLREPMSYRRVNLERVIRVEDLCAPRRFRNGDLVRISRGDGSASLGVVVGREPDGNLRVEVEVGRGIGLRELPLNELPELNPLKIGDYIEVEGRSFWVAGLDREGGLLVVDPAGRSVDPRALLERIEWHIQSRDQQQTQLIPIGPNSLSALEAPERPLMLSRPLDAERFVPIEAIFDPGESCGLFAGTREADLFALRTRFGQASLHTSRGLNYKPWNEDAAALFADSHGRLFMGVFDQAGGMGSVEDERGAASAIAAQVFFDRMQAFAQAAPGADDPEVALREVVFTAHEAILVRNNREMTTYVGAYLDSDRVVVVNVGDSGAIHFSPDGALLNATQPHALPPPNRHIITEALGSRLRTPRPDSYEWVISEGDYLVLGSDGLLDARLGTDEIGRIVSAQRDAREATVALRDIVTGRMGNRSAKPDNLTIMVARLEIPLTIESGGTKKR